MRLPKSVAVAAAMACTLMSGAQAAMTISNAKTKNVNCSGGVCNIYRRQRQSQCTPASKTMLASSDVTVKSNAAAPGIGILDPLTWASTHRLTLDAYGSIHVRAPVVVEGTAGITLVTNDGGSGGDYNFNTATSGSITFWDMASSLVINGKPFKLENRLKVLGHDIAANPSGNFALAADYDAGTDHPYRAAPVQTVFQGTFEGLGHAIVNLTVEAITNGSTAYAGLFVRSQGVLRDITLSNANIGIANHYVGYAGGLVVYNDGAIKNAAVNGRVGNTETANAGGLVAYNEGTIENATTTGAVGGLEFAGGLAYWNGGDIALSHSDASVSEYSAGALVYDNATSGTIEWSSADGDVPVQNAGFVFQNDGVVTHSFLSGSFSHPVPFAGSNTGQITFCRATGRKGGLVDSNAGLIGQSFTDGNASYWGLVGSMMPGGRIVQSYVTGQVTGSVNDDFVAGLVAVNQYPQRTIDISESYSTALVIHGDDARYVGGLIGNDRYGHHVENSYWDMDTSGITDPGQGSGKPYIVDGITGLTDAQLKSGLPAGFDPNIWGQSASINNGWPYLLANPPQ